MNGRHETRPGATLVAAGAVSVAAFVLYRFTMLPGLELGDSASFQLMGGSEAITPRDGYPLYYALAWPVVQAVGDPARAMNLVSVVEAALAAGIIVLLAAELGAGLPGAAAAGLLFAGSYTFWSQALIAEVYALHILLCSLTMLLLLRWGARPTFARLVTFFAAYALAFGNHLSMILLAPAYAVFLLAAAPGGWRTLMAARVAGAAVIAALAGAAPYLWNFSALWAEVAAPGGVAEALSVFWFDVTKSDWRDTMVLSVPRGMAVERIRMYAFDLVQQFGWIALLAPPGIVYLYLITRSRAALLAIIYAVPLIFALGYNVGDSHVFFLVPHLAVALAIALGLRTMDAVIRSRGAIAAGGCLLAAVRVYNDYPALDRSADHRPAEVLERLTTGLDDRRNIFLPDLNWQVQNGLTYFARRERPAIAYARLPEVLLSAPTLIADNAAAGRAVYVTERGRAALSAAYGPLLDVEADPETNGGSLEQLVDRIPAGAGYVLTILRPAREFSLDGEDLRRAVARLTGGRVHTIPDVDYVVLAGLAGEAPAVDAASPRPFRRRTRLLDMPVDVRMESWLAFDTIRRMGFGHVIAGRRRAQIVERGVSLVAFDASGRVALNEYRAGIFAPQPRFTVTPAPSVVRAIVEP